jgi:hypothetical protein
MLISQCPQYDEWGDHQNGLLDRQKLCSGTIQTSIFVWSTFSLKTVHRGVENTVWPTRFAEKLLLACPDKEYIASAAIMYPEINSRSSVYTANHDTAAVMERWFIRTSCCQQRLSHAAVVNMHSERLDKLDLICMANNFVSKNESRRNVFGRLDFESLTFRSYRKQAYSMCSSRNAVSQICILV